MMFDGNAVVVVDWLAFRKRCVHFAAAVAMVPARDSSNSSRSSSNIL